MPPPGGGSVALRTGCTYRHTSTWVYAHPSFPPSRQYCWCCRIAMTPRLHGTGGQVHQTARSGGAACGQVLL
jgi:hypothetical protein